jgi:hypothetical protein
MRKWLNYMPILVVVSIWLVVVVRNLSASGWVIGWDNLQTELAIPLNLSRSLSAVWQEYQGLGLLAGMAHGADLVRVLSQTLMSLIVPQAYLRYSMIALSWLVGMLGMYKWLTYLLKPMFSGYFRWLAMIGSLFYLLNFGTVQNMFVPFEPFYWYFGIFPWVMVTLQTYLDLGRKRNGFYLLGVGFLASPIAYLQTAFVTLFLILLAIVSVFILIGDRELSVKSRVIRGITGLCLLMIPQLFWLLPVGYFTAVASGVTVEAKMNSIATSEVHWQNYEFGNIRSLLLLEGYWSGLHDLLIDGEYTYLMADWRAFLDDPFVTLIRMSVAFIFILGVVHVAFHRQKKLLGLLAALGLVVMILASRVWLIGSLWQIAETIIPLLSQIFRSPFTKFVVPLVGFYSVFLTIGIGWVIQPLAKVTSWFVGVIMISLGLMIVASSWPVFQGQMVYEQMEHELPVEYIELFDFFATEPLDKRIVHLPMPNFWGWEFYDWGYRGSGFLWYGIKQPILSRAFDVWSRENETFYHELSTAVYQCPPVENGEVRLDNLGIEMCANQIENILQKYQVGYVLLDEHVIQPGQDDLLLRRNEIRQAMEVMEVPLVFEEEGILVWKLPPFTPETFTLAEGDTHYSRKNVVGEIEDYLTTLSENSTRDSVRYPFAQVYREEISDIQFVDSVFGSDEVGFESREMVVEENSRLVVPGMALGFGVSLFGEVEFEPGEVRIGLEPGISLKWQDEDLETDLLRQEIVLPVETESEELLVQVGNEVVRVLQGEVVKIEGVKARVGESVRVQVFDASASNQVQTTPNFDEATTQQCWVREGYTPTIEEESGPGTRQFTVSNASACLPLKLELAIEESNLLEIRLPYQSDRARPHFCVTREDATEYRCLHDEVFYAEEASPEGSEVSRYVTQESGNSYWVDIVARPSDMADDEWTIRYQAPQIISWPLIAAAEVNEAWWERYREQQEFLVSGTGTLRVGIEVDPEVLSPAVLAQTQVKNCDVFGRGEIDKQVSQMRFTDPDYSRATIFYKAKDRAAACDSIMLPDISTQREYILRLSGEGMAGRGLKFYLNNLASGRNDLEILLPEGEFDRAFGLLAWPYYAEDGYALNLETRSFGSEESVNRLDQVRVYPVSLGWLSRVRVEPEAGETQLRALPTQLVTTWGTSHYQFKVQNSKLKDYEHGVIVLDQGYDKGWSAFDVSELKPQISNLKMIFPWWFGERLEHVKVNGWANGFIIDNSKLKTQNSKLQLKAQSDENQKQIVIVYLPQYLEWIGLGILILTFGVLLQRFYWPLRRTR